MSGSIEPVEPSGRRPDGAGRTTVQTGVAAILALSFPRSGSTRITHFVYQAHIIWIVCAAHSSSNYVVYLYIFQQHSALTQNTSIPITLQQDLVDLTI